MDLTSQWCSQNSGTAIPRMKAHANQSDERTPDLPSVVVTIDGPAGAGKSSVAQELAIRLGLDFLDTGAMYRAVAWVALETGINLDDADKSENAVAAAVAKSEIKFDWRTKPPRVWVDYPAETDLTERIRDADITKAVSIVARMPSVRHEMVKRQRAVRDAHPRLVTEGRDQGSVVFPDAEVILYLDASPEERAQRRTKQLRDSGRVPDQVDVQVVLNEIIKRDEMDRNRTHGPLRKPENAVIVDTSQMTQQAVVDHLEELVRTELPAPIAATLKNAHLENKQQPN